MKTDKQLEEQDAWPGLSVGLLCSLGAFAIVMIGVWHRHHIEEIHSTKSFIEANEAFATGIELTLVTIAVIGVSLLMNSLALIIYFLNLGRRRRLHIGICMLIWSISMISVIMFCVE